MCTSNYFNENVFLTNVTLSNPNNAEVDYLEDVNFLKKFLPNHQVTIVSVDDNKVAILFDNGKYSIRYIIIEEALNIIASAIDIYGTEVTVGIPIGKFKYYNQGELVRDNGLIKVC